jgi:hypothetical protein
MFYFDSKMIFDKWPVHPMDSRYGVGADVTTASVLLFPPAPDTSAVVKIEQTSPHTDRNIRVSCPKS